MSAAQQQLHALGAAQQAQDVRVTTPGSPQAAQAYRCGRVFSHARWAVGSTRRTSMCACRGRTSAARAEVFPLTCSRRTTSRGRKDDPRANRSRSPAIF